MKKHKGIHVDMFLALALLFYSIAAITPFGNVLAQTLPKYELHGQVLPADLDLGYHITYGDLDTDSRPDIILVACAGSPTIYI